ncbi:predicted protein [Naegleria gruberi]|uniref:Predicted protein n=1 Tax=Naegleria gruberi TaxID=5762 RepID=D2W3G0_NAEGR|nr:uncharacterized protein NAEGRDRAFT_82230 [Naegleria gruberi]EFC36415.1 predicted protein [Naegleria gruberi]|eukprot:XP_002669159.1 predicted protein [Naegleria gruberi strain NEG-M]
MLNKITSLFSRGKLQVEEKPTNFTVTSVSYRWICNMCLGVIENTIRYTNTNDKGTDLCEKCYDWCWDKCKKRRKNASPNHQQVDNEEKTPEEKERELWLETFCEDLEYFVPTKYHYHEIKQRSEADRVNSTLFRSFIENSMNPCFGILKEDDGPYHWLRYEQVFHLVCCIAVGLDEILKPLREENKRQFVSICGKNNLYWYLCDYACFFKGFVAAPIHFAQTFDETKHIVELTDSQVVVCTLEMLDFFISITKQLDFVKYIVVMDDNEGKSKSKFTTNSGKQEIEILPMNEIIDKGKSILCEYLNEKNKPKKKRYPKHFENHETILVTPKNKYNPNKMWIDVEHQDFILNRLEKDEDLLSLVFTSGSTGQPKGIMVSDKSLRREMHGFRAENPKVQFSFCPLAHMSDRKHTLLAMCDGARVGIFTRDFVHIFEDIQKVKPTVIASTPRLYNVLYDEYKKVYELEKTSWLSGISNQNEDRPKTERELEERVMKDFRNMLGGRLQSIIIGGASSSPQVREFLGKCFNCFVSDGFGMSEAGGIMNDNRLHSSVEYKLVDVPDMNYFTNDKPYPRGELCVKTKTMFIGYYKNEELTKNALDEEGWLHTNDIVEELGPRHIRIIDRLKNIFKLSQGEFIAPAKIEDALTTSKFIFQAFIYGNVSKSYLVGVIVPNQTVLKQFAIKEGLINSSSEELLSDSEKDLLKTNEKVKKVLCEEIEKVSVNCSLLPYEVPKDFIIEFESFSEKNDLLTSSMKVKRFGCEMKYKEELEALYEHLESINKRKLDEDLIRELLLNSQTGSAESDGNMKIIDSLHAVKFSGIMKQKYNIDVPLSLIFSQTDRNVDSVVSRVSDFVTKNQHDDVATVNSSHDWKKDILLPEDVLNDIIDLTSRGNTQFKKIADLKKGILLTGSTGFLGAFILRDLLEALEKAEENVKVYCIVREKNHQDDVFMRVKENLVEFKLWNDKYEKRISVVKGNLGDDNLGLTEEEFKKLAENIDIIYHNGAYVNSVMSYPQLFSSNTGSTLSLLKLACLSSKLNIQSGDSTLAPIVFVSTVGVLQSGLSLFGIPTSTSGISNKKDITDLINNHMDQVMRQLKPIIERANGYSSTKFVAEQYIQQARLLGYPGAIFRPGMIGSDTVNGVSNLIDWVNRLVMGCFEMNCFPKTNRTLNIVPVDIISRVIVQLTQNENAFVTDLHENPNYFIFELANLDKFVIHIDDLLSIAATTEAKLLKKEPMQNVTYQKWKQILNERNTKEENEMLLRLATLFKSDYEFPGSGDRLTNSHVHKVIQALSKLEDSECKALIPFKNLDQSYLAKQATFLVNSKTCH